MKLSDTIVLSWQQREICILEYNFYVNARLNKNLEDIKIYKVSGKIIFNQMAPKAKDVELTKAFVAAFSGNFRTRPNVWDGALCYNS